MATLDPFNARRTLEVGGDYYALEALDANGVSTHHLPYSVRILLEGALRGHDGFLITEDDIRTIAAWAPKGERTEIPFRPCLLYTSPSPRDRQKSRMPSSA